MINGDFLWLFEDEEHDVGCVGAGALEREILLMSIEL